MNMTVGQRIKQRRLELGLSQEELAHKLGNKSRASVSTVEHDKEDLTTTRIKQYASALETTPAHLMGWDSDAKAIAADTDWFETGLSLLGWEEKEEERDNAKYETTLSNGKESVRVSADDIECMTNALKMYLLNMLTGSKRANNASLDLSDEESLLLQGFHAMGEESQRYLLMMARDALGAKSNSSEMSSISHADVVSA